MSISIFKPACIFLVIAMNSTGAIVPSMSGDRVLQIAHAAYTAGDQNARTAYVALDITKSSIVKTYAQRMVDDHTAVNEKANAILSKLNMVLENSKRSKELVSYAKSIRADLRKVSPAKFDCAYAISEMKYHGVMNKTIAKYVLPNLNIKQLNELFSDALVKFKVHWGHAELMVKKLDCKK